MSIELSIEHGLWWATQLRLESWNGYQSRYGPYGSQDTAQPSDGSVNLIFAPEGRGLEPLNDSERDLLDWFMGNEPAVSAAVKASILEWCAADSEDRLSGFDYDEEFPSIHTYDDLKANVGLYAINIHFSTDGIPYVGFEFGCEWDDEHGLGVLMHGLRTVQVGWADTAFTLWIAEEDAENRAQAEPT